MKKGASLQAKEAPRPGLSLNGPFGMRAECRMQMGASNLNYAHQTTRSKFVNYNRLVVLIASHCLQLVPSNPQAIALIEHNN